MSRPLTKLLGSAAQRLFDLAGERPDVAPVIAPLGELTAYVAADADDYIANRLADAESIRALLIRARDGMPPEAIAEVDRALAWQPAQPGDFRRERIDEYLATLRRALIVVHAWLESQREDSHAALLADLWAFLKADVARSSRLVRSLW